MLVTMSVIFFENVIFIPRKHYIIYITYNIAILMMDVIILFLYHLFSGISRYCLPVLTKKMRLEIMIVNWINSFNDASLY